LTTFVAFLRAINVAGRGVVKMDALCKSFSGAGCRKVRTYIQSGNVIFDTQSSEGAIHRKLRRELRALLGTEPGIFLRTLDEIYRLTGRDPFAKFRHEQNAKLYVAFLSERPKVKLKFPLVFPKEGLEVFGMSGREAFIVSRPKPTGGYGFPNPFIEKELRVSATTRNWNTVTRIAKFAQVERAE
jgi:uncharacterized protein (DUF1697 family)